MPGSNPVIFCFVLCFCDGVKTKASSGGIGLKEEKKEKMEQL